MTNRTTKEFKIIVYKYIFVFACLISKHPFVFILFFNFIS